MWHEQFPRAEGNFFQSLRALTGAAFGRSPAQASAAGAPAPAPSLTRMSDKGLFQVHLSSDVLPIPIRRSHIWTVQVSNQGGGSVYGAWAEISHAAPEHHDKPLAQPWVAATDDPGIYKINGVCFSKSGGGSCASPSKRPTDALIRRHLMSASNSRARRPCGRTSAR